MRFSLLIALFFGCTTQSLACLHIYGHFNIHFYPHGYHYSDADISAWDNGQLTCWTGWGWTKDHAGNLGLNCLAGFIYATDGTTGWYRNGPNAYQLAMDPRVTAIVESPEYSVYRNDLDKWFFCGARRTADNDTNEPEEEGVTKLDITALPSILNFNETFLANTTTQPEGTAKLTRRFQA